jgi:hypothetical integral membrane protein (TIGR02206 family)
MNCVKLLAVQPFSPQHLITVIACLFAMILFAAFGRRCKRNDREFNLRRSFALFFIAWQVFTTIWWLLPRNYDVAVSLPLHVCDLAAWIAPFALLFQDKRWLRTMLYFWGFGFSTEAFITPILDHGPDSVHFWLFWGGHTLIVGAALYDVVVCGYRPRFRDFLVATAFSLSYSAIIIGLNVAIGANYGYLGQSKPGAPTLIDHLGQWPLRAIWMILLGELFMLLLWAPWAIAGRNGKRELTNTRTSASSLPHRP